jgi:hypothetical protein
MIVEDKCTWPYLIAPRNKVVRKLRTNNIDWQMQNPGGLEQAFRDARDFCVAHDGD